METPPSRASLPSPPPLYVTPPTPTPVTGSSARRQQRARQRPLCNRNLPNHLPTLMSSHTEGWRLQNAVSPQPSPPLPAPPRPSVGRSEPRREVREVRAAGSGKSPASGRDTHGQDPTHASSSPQTTAAGSTW